MNKVGTYLKKALKSYLLQTAKIYEGQQGKYAYRMFL